MGGRARATWGTPTDFDRLKGQVEGQKETGEMATLEKDVLHEEWGGVGGWKQSCPWEDDSKRVERQRRGEEQGVIQSWLALSIKCHDYRDPLPRVVMYAIIYSERHTI